MRNTRSRLKQAAAAIERKLHQDAPPIQQPTMLEQEYVHLHGKRPAGPAATMEPGAEPGLADIHSAIHAQGHTAICLSGGGVRSASFAVGVLQGLARRNTLPAFDYVSTVSGGGYTGGWLSAWLHHTVNDGNDPGVVFRSLAGDDASATAPEAEPVRRIREYSNYLDPKLGAFSADVWTLVATVGRNLILNWLVLLPLVAAALLVPRLYFALLGLGPQDWIDVSQWVTPLVVTAFVLIALALGYIVLDLPSCGNRQWGQRAFLMWCLGPLATATAALTLYWAWTRELSDPRPLSLVVVVVVGVVLHGLTWVVAGLLGRSWFRPQLWMAAAVSGAAAGLGVWWFTRYPFANPLARGELFAGAGVPIILLTIACSGTLFVGLASGASNDEDREWWGRFGAWLLIATVGWSVASAIVFMGPPVLGRILDWTSKTLGTPDAVTKSLYGIVTALVGGTAARAGRVENAKDALLRRIALIVAAPVFVVLLLMLLSAVNVWLLTRIDMLHVLPEYVHVQGGGLPEVVVLGLALAAFGAVMGSFVAANKFSLHGMYRSRLIRAFLGASRPKTARHPNRFTGFDQDDNVYMHELTTVRRPLHVVNMTLNLVADNRLAWQERKAESFFVSPLHAGACGVGYRPIRQYGGPRGMSLGTAITISGAAASPNMGSHSSPAMTFLLTLFNARLGAWLGNPSDAGRWTWRKSDPVAGAGPLLREMFGRTTDENPYVFLSDGGHFENLGLYEMVARRCRYIVVSDAGCDPDYAFEDLGNAIRKIRIDFGIPIEFPNGLDIGKLTGGGTRGHAAVGHIKYSAVDGAVADGRLVYLKTALSGDEPVDVLNYATAHPAFPHESTADQWFGESQFESYRALGLHTIAVVGGDYDGKAGVAGFVVAVEDHLQQKIVAQAPPPAPTLGS